MLEPHDRRLLLEALRPPLDFRFDCAVATTFSLDLEALLTAPLAFTMFDWADGEEGHAADPLALLEAVRRHADSISIFCQAGQIAIPPRDRTLFGYLESSVVEVMAPNGHGVFHPKLWVLRFVGPKRSVRYRVLCLSRNLTFDRSWDTLLILDGEVARSRDAVEQSAPLADFVKTLPRLALRPVPGLIRENVRRVERELRRVRFTPPDGFDEIRFWPLGVGGAARWPFDGRVDRMLVVSPFVTEGCLQRLSARGSGHVLVSRPEALDALRPACLDRFDRVSVLSDAADAESTDDSAEDTSLRPAEAPPTGLHAKVYVADSGWRARVWTGSANATEAAFAHNVELLVELVGTKSRHGVEAVLTGGQGRTSFGDLLVSFTPSAEPLLPDTLQVRLDRLVDDARRALARARLTATVETLEDDLYGLRLDWAGSTPTLLQNGVTVRCWPITISDTMAQTLATGSGTAVSFGRLSFEALTSFFAFHVSATAGQCKAGARFVLNLPLLGAPADRRERILRSLLKDRAQVLRLLLLLLAEGGVGSRDALMLSRQLTAGTGQNGVNEAALPLFEPLARALVDAPDKLDRVARLVADLTASPDGEQLLPDGFDEIWQPILEARARLAQ